MGPLMSLTLKNLSLDCQLIPVPITGTPGRWSSPTGAGPCWASSQPSSLRPAPGAASCCSWWATPRRSTSWAPPAASTCDPERPSSDLEQPISVQVTLAADVCHAKALTTLWALPAASICDPERLISVQVTSAARLCHPTAYRKSSGPILLGPTSMISFSGCKHAEQVYMCRAGCLVREGVWVASQARPVSWKLARFLAVSEVWRSYIKQPAV